MNIRQFEYLLALAKIKSFRKASEQLYVTQPAISKQIAAFEDELGLNLFDRSYGDVTLTPEGEVIHDAISRCVVLFNDALAEARKINAKNKKQINFGINELSEFPGFSEVMSAFHSKYPDIVISIERARLENLNFSESENNYDIILTHEVGIRKEKGILTHNLRTIHQSALISCKNPLAQKPNLSFCDLKNQRFLIPSSTLDSVSKEYCIEICESAGFKPPEIVPMHNIDSMITAVEMDLGVALLDEKVPARQLNGIIRIPSPYYSHFLIAWKDNNDPIINSLINEIVEHCGL